MKKASAKGRSFFVPKKIPLWNHPKGAIFI